MAESTEMRKKEHEEGNMCHIVACCWKHLFFKQNHMIYTIFDVLEFQTLDQDCKYVGVCS